ncbi:MAG: hypothetical protein AAGI53_08930 [Planctomycetota bacterium]
MRYRGSVLLCVALIAGCANHPELRTATYADEVDGNNSFCEWFLGNGERWTSGGGRSIYEDTLRASSERGEIIIRTIDGNVEWGYDIIDRILVSSDPPAIVAMWYRELFEPVKLYRTDDQEVVEWWLDARDLVVDAYAVWPSLTDHTYAMSPGESLLVVPGEAICVEVGDGHPALRVETLNDDPVLRYVLPDPRYERADLAWIKASVDPLSLRDVGPFGVILSQVYETDGSAIIGSAMANPHHPIWEEWEWRAEQEDRYSPDLPESYVDRIRRLKEIAGENATGR